MTAVLISSFDGYSDCWPPLFYSLDKYWPDCPFDIFLTTNQLESGHARIAALKLGDDAGWARQTKAALARIAEPVVVYLQEDYWLRRRVNNAAILDYVNVVASGMADYVRLNPRPRPNRKFDADARLGVIGERAGYRASLQASVWRVETLASLIDESESAWEFELGATERSRALGERFLSVWRARDGLDYVATAINGGRWSRGAKDFVRREHLDFDFSKRPHDTWKHELGYTRFGRAYMTSNLRTRVKALTARPAS